MNKRRDIMAKKPDKGLKHRISADEQSVEVKTHDRRYIELADKMIENAVKMKVSDIHIEAVNRTERQIRYRIDGILTVVKRLSQEEYKGLIGRIKILAKMTIGDSRRILDGSFEWDNVNDANIDIRVSQLPTKNGEKLVLRVLYGEMALIPIEHLGFSKSDLQRVKRMIRYKNGLILNSGPTGCGKTTTLYSFLNAIRNDRINVMTLEDPLEINLSGVNQTEVDTINGVDFKTGLSAMLRQDPDVIMIGEIRDENTANMAVRSSITGHLVLSSVHSGSAIATISRLQNMGIENYMMAESIRGIIAQRLIKKLCVHCKEEMVADPYEKAVLSVDEGRVLYKPKGCKRCGNRGYSGRVGVFEVLEFNKGVRRCLVENDKAIQADKIAECAGFLSFKAQIRDLILSGTTDFHEGMGAIDYGRY